MKNQAETVLKLWNVAHPMEGGKPIFLPFGEWDYDGRVRQRLDKAHGEAIANELNARGAKGEPGIPVYQGHPDVPQLAARYPDKGALGWIVRAVLANQDGREGLELAVEWDRDPGRGFRWFSPYWDCEMRGAALAEVCGLRSIGLVNNPNIREFRLANEDNLEEPTKQETIMDLKKLIELLGLSPDADEEAVAAAIAKGKAALDAAAEAEAEEARKKQEEAETALANERKARIGLVLDTAIASGHITPAARAAWEKRLGEDFEAGSVALANERQVKTKSVTAGLNPKDDARASTQLLELANERRAKTGCTLDEAWEYAKRNRQI